MDGIEDNGQTFQFNIEQSQARTNVAGKVQAVVNSAWLHKQRKYQIYGFSIPLYQRKIKERCIHLLSLSSFPRPVPGELQPAGRDGGSETEHQQAEQRGMIHMGSKS